MEVCDPAAEKEATPRCVLMLHCVPCSAHAPACCARHCGLSTEVQVTLPMELSGEEAPRDVCGGVLTIGVYTPAAEKEAQGRLARTEGKVQLRARSKGIHAAIAALRVP